MHVAPGGTAAPLSLRTQTGVLLVIMQGTRAHLKRTERKGAATREALMSVATDLFADQGFDGTSVEQITAGAGVNKAMISYHFGGKRRLYNEILSATFSEAHRRFHAIRESDAPADKRLRDFIQTFADLATLSPALPTMVLREALSGGLHIDAKLLPQFLEIFRLVQEIIDQGIEEGTFSAVNPYLTHVSLLGSLVFFFALKPIRSRLADGKLPTSASEVREFVRHLQTIMAHGLAPADPTPELI